MATGKWIGGFLGLLSGGPIGALAGFVLGALFDTMSSDNGLIGDGEGGGSGYDRTAQGTRNGFLFSLLTLASYIIRADGKVMHSEMEAIRQFLRANFGEAAVEEGNAILLRLFEQQKQMDATQPGAFRQTINDCCAQMRGVLSESQRLQLLSLLAMLAKADGHVAPEEITALREVTAALGLSEAELNSMLGLGSTSLMPTQCWKSTRAQAMTRCVPPTSVWSSSITPTALPRWARTSARRPRKRCARSTRPETSSTKPEGCKRKAGATNVAPVISFIGG